MMAFNVNDLESRAYSVAVADDDAVAGPCRVFGMGLTRGADAATKAGGGTTIRLYGDASESELPVQFKWTPNGIRFDTGLSVTLTGAGATGWVAYIEE
jgi:hypothetical protein